MRFDKYNNEDDNTFSISPRFLSMYINYLNGFNFNCELLFSNYFSYLRKSKFHVNGVLLLLFLMIPYNSIYADCFFFFNLTET